MDQSLSWEANDHLSSKETPHLLWNSKVQYHVHMSPIPWACVTFCNKLIFYSEELLVTCLIPKLEDHPLSAPQFWGFTMGSISIQMKQ